MRAFIWIAGLLLVSACATTPNTPEEPLVATTPTETVGLSARKLAPGTCGLFIWSASQPPHFLAYIEQGQSHADVFYNGAETSFILLPPNAVLTLTARIHLRLKQVNTNDILDITLAEQQDIPKGSRYAKGTLISNAKEGWRRTIPIIGIAGCAG